jgi:hypothetical protein
VAVIDEQHVGLQSHRREPAGELLGVEPVGLRPFSVEQARLGEHETPRADRCDSRRPLTEQTFDIKPSDLDDTLRENIDERRAGPLKTVRPMTSRLTTQGRRHDRSAAI